MDETRTAQATIMINASPSRVWEAITNPEMIKQYLFGTQVTTDWQPGSPIRYSGVWQGKPYEDKGEILQVEPEQRLVSTFWSALSGLPDVPESYKTVSYMLAREGNGTRLTVTQDNNDSEEEVRHSEENWRMVLEGIKKLLEGG